MTRSAFRTPTSQYCPPFPTFQLSSYSLQPTLEAQDVGVVPSSVASFDDAVGIIIAANHVTAIVLTSGVRKQIRLQKSSSNKEVDEEDQDISRMVLTSELKELPPLILSEYFSAKVTVRSKMTILKKFRYGLTEEDKTVFRSYPQLGPLIDLPIGGEFSGALAHNLLLRKTVCQKDHEVWFLIEGKPLRFFLNEFVLISGLYMSGGPSEDEIKAQEEHNELKNKYWPTKKSVLLVDVAKKLKELSVTNDRTNDKLKLAFLYMVAGFLTSSDSKKVVNPSWLQYANDLNFFTQYPWRNVCYNQILDYIKTDLVAKFNKSSSAYNFYGCPWIFQIWAFEAMPKLGEMMAKKLALNEKNKNGPRWLR
ncbi:hypothetical protein TIFTF001_048582, partial [Ficus carica]